MLKRAIFIELTKDVFSQIQDPILLSILLTMVHIDRLHLKRLEYLIVVLLLSS